MKSTLQCKYVKKSAFYSRDLVFRLADDTKKVFNECRIMTKDRPNLSCIWFGFDKDQLVFVQPRHATTLNKECVFSMQQRRQRTKTPAYCNALRNSHIFHNMSLNPFLSSGTICSSIVKIFILRKEEIIEKKSYKCRAYESRKDFRQ